MRASRALALYQNTSDDRLKPTLRYEPVLTRLPRSLIDKFELMHRDAETEAFLDRARQLNVFTLALSGFFSYFLSRTTSNGITGRGFMFVFSSAQAHQLLRPFDVTLEQYQEQLRASSNVNNNRVDELENEQGADDEPVANSSIKYEKKFSTLLDIGAGDGGVTEKLAPFVEEVFTTEYSATMRWRLKRRGYTVLGHENPFITINPETNEEERRQYDIISFLNVLDRIDRPLDILKEMHASLRPDGILLMAVVLPWCPFVEDNNKQRRPSQLLPMEGGECCKGAKFEDSLTRLVENVLEPEGFELVRWTKLPYLCEGNLKVEYAVLHDAVMVLRKKEQNIK